MGPNGGCLGDRGLTVENALMPNILGFKAKSFLSKVISHLFLSYHGCGNKKALTRCETLDMGLLSLQNRGGRDVKRYFVCIY